MYLEPSERAKGKRSLEKVGEKEKGIVCVVVVVGVPVLQALGDHCMDFCFY